jgi:hypothetical protein
MRNFAVLWANGPPPLYHVKIPPGSEKWYQFAAPIALSFAIAAIGLWLARSRSIRKTGGRLLLWTAGGCLTVGYSAWWIWSHRNYGTFEPDSIDVAACYMPCLWPVFCIVLIVIGRRFVRPPRKPNDGPPDA